MKYGVFLALLLLTISSCKFSSQRQFLVMVDFSASTKENREFYKNELIKVVNNIPGRSQLIIGKVAAKTESEFSPICNEKMEANDYLSKEVLGRAIKIERQQKAIMTALADTIDKEFQNLNLSKDTNVISCLYMMNDIYPPNKNIKRTLIILSDMLQDNEQFNLDRSLNKADIDSMIASIKKKRSLPDLSNVKVIVIGAAAKNDQQYVIIKDFWSRVIRDCKASLVSYGHSFTDINLLK